MLACIIKNMEYQITDTIKLIEVSENHFDVVTVESEVVLLCLDRIELAILGAAISSTQALNKLFDERQP